MFGDGHDYDWALVDDEELGQEEESAKAETKYQDVSECPTRRVPLLHMLSGL